jgi:hypothetical protein
VDSSSSGIVPFVNRVLKIRNTYPEEEGNDAAGEEIGKNKRKMKTE